MSKLVAFVKGEPAVLISVAGAAVGIAADFGLHLSTQQADSLYGFVAILAGVLIRQTVVPNAKVDGRLAAVETALQAFHAPAAVTSVVEAAAEAPKAAATEGPTAGP